jgi:hypothetical protein
MVTLTVRVIPLAVSVTVIVCLCQAGLRSHGNATTPGVLTEHRGEAGPVRDLLGGGHAPTALAFCHLSP